MEFAITMKVYQQDDKYVGEIETKYEDGTIETLSCVHEDFEEAKYHALDKLTVVVNNLTYV